MLWRSLLVLLACLSLALAATPAPAAQIQLAWDAPVQDNGAPFPDLAGYKLYYGSQSGQYQTVVPVDLVTTYTVTNVSAGQTYYFVITAYDIAGTESMFSNEVRVTLPTSTIPPQQMQGVSVDSQELVSGNRAVTKAIDDNATTFSPTMATLTSSASTAAMTASQNTRWELTLTSTRTYANPFLDVTVTVEYTKAGSPPLQGYGFWDGGATFRLRQSFPEPGTWHYKTTASDPSNSGLHNREGDVQVLPYNGSNPLYRHGFLQVSADRRFLTHADGTPFLWLGDTLWGATVWLTEAGFHEAVADRQAKYFTVLQTNFARANEVDTAGDTLWQGDRWNVRFMQKLDRLFSDANDQGMYLFVDGLTELLWNRTIPHSERLVEML